MWQFFSMGGYGTYVWSAFAVTLFLMIGLFLESWVTLGRRQRELDALRSEGRFRPPRQSRRLVARRAETAEAEPLSQRSSSGQA